MKKMILKRIAIFLIAILIAQLGLINDVSAVYNGEPTYIKNIGGVDYAIQEFKSSGTFIVPSYVTKVDVTVVGGGAGGGSGYNGSYCGGGGGGGGGYVINSDNVSVSGGTSIGVVVGNGGTPGQNGGQSSFGTIVANGGSGGKSGNKYVGGNGGTGGSGGGAGGNESSSGTYHGGGDGGTNGSDGETVFNGGLHSYYGDYNEGGTGQVNTTIGVNNIRYAGGGGGGAGGFAGPGVGGLGGGGKGAAKNGLPVAATINTGGGGGGGNSTSGGGGVGGSGIVVICWVANQKPTITVTSPVANSAYSEVAGYTNISLTGTVSDPNLGNIITTKYNIDGGTTQTVSGTVTNSGSFTPTSINASIYTEGTHTLNVWAVDNIGEASAIAIRYFKVDKTAPTLGTVTVTSTTSSIIIAGSATDSLAGPNQNPYRYTVSTKPTTGWLPAATTPAPFSSLEANTNYTTTFEARDAVENIKTNTQTIYTKAIVPTVTVSNETSYTLDVTMSEKNPASTPYMIVVTKVNADGTLDVSKYVTPEGTLTTSAVWITPTGKKITVKGLSASTTYKFQVKAKNGNEIDTILSSSVSGTTLIAPPAAPANMIATATDTKINISWDAAATATGYDIEADGVIVSTGTATAYVHTGLYPGTPHTYRVRGKNAGGSGSWSAAISKSTLPSTPGVPTNLTVIPLSTSVTVTWDNVPGATGYDVEVDGVLVSNGPNTNYKHTSLTPGTSHTYRVRSINAGAKSGWSNSVTTVTQIESTPVPVNISTVSAKNQIAVTWDSVNGATGYEIEVDGVRLDNNTRTTYTHTSLEPGTDHRYRVRAKIGVSVSDWSTMTIATTLTDGFGVPGNFKAYAEDTKVSLSWDAVTDAVSYDVELDGVIVNNGADNFCVHEGLEPNITHNYRVRANSTSATSDWSKVLTVATYTLPTPKNIITTTSETSIQTVWDSVYGATSYDLEFDGTIIPDIAETTYNCDKLRSGTQHTLSVRAKNSYGTSNWSIPINESTIKVNSNIPALYGIARKSSVTLMWNSIEIATSYDLETDGVLVENMAGNTYLHNSLSPGSQHTYRIRTRNEASIGEWSSAFIVVTLSETPAIPTNTTASSTMSSILVSWDKVAGAEGYEIEVDGVVVDNGIGSSYLHNNLPPDSIHNYRVRAKNLGGYSDWSGVVSKSTISSVQTYTLDCVTGDEFNLMLSAANMQDLGNYSFTVRYDVVDFDVTDLCGLTARIDTATGNITGTDIKVTQYEPGAIVFTKLSSAQTYEVWSGVVNSIKFKAKHDGQMVITYSIN